MSLILGVSVLVPPLSNFRSMPMFLALIPAPEANNNLETEDVKSPRSWSKSSAPFMP